MASPYPVLALAVLFVSFGSVLIRLAEAPPLAVSFYRIALAALCLFPFAARGAGASWRTLAPRRRLMHPNHHSGPLAYVRARLDRRSSRNNPQLL